MLLLLLIIINLLIIVLLRADAAAHLRAGAAGDAVPGERRMCYNIIQCMRVYIYIYICMYTQIHTISYPIIAYHMV